MQNTTLIGISHRVGQCISTILHKAYIEKLVENKKIGQEINWKFH
jgi:hypothetical protein